MNDVSLSVHAGEIVGVAGVSGNGQHELAQVIAGLRPLESGTILVDGEDVTGQSPDKMNSLGLSHIPEERMIDGVIKDFTVAENLILQDHWREPFARGGLLLDFSAIRESCRTAIKEYEIKTPNTDTPIKNLSGGNIQKLILATRIIP